MIFTQLVFALFFLVTFCVHWALRKNSHRKLWLLCASCFFYGYWDYRFLSLLAFCLTVDILTARALGSATDERRRKLLITLSIVVNLTVLGVFKYYNFFVDSVWGMLHSLGIRAHAPTLRIALPVGVSFFTFQSMSYTIDVYRRKIPPQKAYTDFAFFVTFFPQLVAGPIVRAADFLPQVTRDRFFRDIDVRRALGLFAIGYFKKACVADNIAQAIDPVYLHPLDFDAASRTLSSLLYSVQIYCDFSGYTDMATAVAALFGFTLAKNFDAPYLATNIQEFWQRWHISLSTWLRDYLYIPLGGNRGGTWFVARNLFLTMVIGGLWHGANWTFVLWGALHGLALVAHRFVARRIPPVESRALSLMGWAATLFWVVSCFTIFRAPNIETARVFFTAETAHSALAVSPVWWLIISMLGAMQLFGRSFREQLKARIQSLDDRAFYAGLGLACSGLLYLTPTNMSPFIYFQF